MKLELSVIEQAHYARYERRAFLLKKFARTVVAGYCIVAAVILAKNLVHSTQSLEQRLAPLAPNSVQIPVEVVQKVETGRTSHWDADHLWLLVDQPAEINCKNSSEQICRYLQYATSEQAAFVRLQMAINHKQLDEARGYLSQIDLPTIYASPDYLVNPKVAYLIENAMYGKPESDYLKNYLGELEHQYANELAETQQTHQKWQYAKNSLLIYAGWCGLVAFLALAWSISIQRRLKHIRGVNRDTKIENEKVFLGKLN